MEVTAILKRGIWPALVISISCAWLQWGDVAHAQAALLMEAPFGLGGALNPTGHDAIYFARICAETPVKLRRCAPGEEGAVIARYRDVGGYDWLAIPLTPYLYSVERASEIPARADREAVRAMRKRYLEAHLYGIPIAPNGKPAPQGNWDELVGTLYDRRTYAFRFDTTPQQDDALIEWMNSNANLSRFSLVRNNCADFAAKVLDFYFPGAFHRRLLPDARITTPRQNSWELVKYAKKHPEIGLSIVEIPQVPGSRIRSRNTSSLAGALLASGDLAPVAWLAPPLAGVVCLDYLIWGRYPMDLKHAPKVSEDALAGPTDVATSRATDEGEGQTLSEADSGSER